MSSSKFLTKRYQYHQQLSIVTGCNFTIVQTTQLYECITSEIQSNFFLHFPRHSVIIRFPRFVFASYKCYMTRPSNSAIEFISMLEWRLSSAYLSPSRVARCINKSSGRPSTSSLTQGNWKNSSRVLGGSTAVSGFLCVCLECHRRISATQARLGWVDGDGIWWGTSLCRRSPIFLKASTVICRVGCFDNCRFLLHLPYLELMITFFIKLEERRSGKKKDRRSLRLYKKNAESENCNRECTPPVSCIKDHIQSENMFVLLIITLNWHVISYLSSIQTYSLVIIA